MTRLVPSTRDAYNIERIKEKRKGLVPYDFTECSPDTLIKLAIMRVADRKTSELTKDDRFLIRYMSSILDRNYYRSSRDEQTRISRYFFSKIFR